MINSVPEIERAIQQLPPEELAKFREWFVQFDAARWDRQFEKDVAEGRLDALGDEAIQELRDGHTTSGLA